MSVILTNQFNRSENIAAANKAAAIQAGGRQAGRPRTRQSCRRR